METTRVNKIISVVPDHNLHFPVLLIYAYILLPRLVLSDIVCTFKEPSMLRSQKRSVYDSLMCLITRFKMIPMG